MNFAQRLRLCWYAAAMVLAGSSACASRQGTANLSSQQVPLVRADSEVFEAVVRAQLAATKKDYPFHLDGLRYDSRPSTPIVAFRITARPTRRVDTSGLFQTPDAATLSRLAVSRKQILERAGVEEGGPFPRRTAPAFSCRHLHLRRQDHQRRRERVSPISTLGVQGVTRTISP